MEAHDLHSDGRRRRRRGGIAALAVCLVACSSGNDDDAGRCDAITESVVADAGGWSLLDVDDFAEADTCTYVLDTGRLQVRYRDGDAATDTSTGWIGLDDLVTSAEAEGAVVVELEVGDQSYLMDDSTAGAQTPDGTVIISVQNGTLLIDRASATTLLTAAIEALG